LADADPDISFHVHANSHLDGDQQGEYGFSAAPGWDKANVVFVFLETIRDRGAWTQAAKEENWPVAPPPATAAVIEKRNVVHELGHVFGWDSEGPDGTLMKRFEQDSDINHKFNEEQIKKIRSSKEIEDDN
jgi:hypothetical protein